MINEFLLYLTLTVNNAETESKRNLEFTAKVHDVTDEFHKNNINTEGGSYHGSFDVLIFKIEKETVIESSLEENENSSDEG